MGYNTDIFSPAPSASCICAVCHDVLKDANALNCGHTFCFECIKSIIRSSTRANGAQCPNCRVAIASSNPNYVVREIIDELQVRCPNSTECNWMGRVKDLRGHDNTCMYKVIKCGVEGCTHTCLRKDMDNHLSDMNVKLKHMELKCHKKIQEMGGKCGSLMMQMEKRYEGMLEECEKKCDTKLKQMETKYKMKFMEYENKMQEYENRLQTTGGDSARKEKRKRSSSPIPDHIWVQECGTAEVNGVYSRDGEYLDAPKYVRTGQYKGREEVFSLYWHYGIWFISIIRGSTPGINDTDFYASSSPEPLPPLSNWRVREGENPAPKVHSVSVSL